MGPGGLAARFASASFFSSLLTRAWDDAASACRCFAFFRHRVAFASERFSLALSFLILALSFFSDDELFFFVAMAASVT